jgi:hypothetical protein
MNRTIRSRPRARFTAAAQCLLAVVALTGPAVPSAQAGDDSAQSLLKAMSDYVKDQGNLSLKYDADIEVVTPSIEKIQFSASGDVTMSRPDKFRISRTGGYADVELVSDGSTLTVHDKDGNRFAQVPVSGSFDKIVDRLRTEFLIDLPGADLLLSNPYEELGAGVLEAKHIGRGVVDGVECEHLAFRNYDTDWQIWIETGEHPVPRKYVITSKTVAAAPQYTLRLKEWKTGGNPAADAFAFKPPAGASGVAITALKDIDEIPPGVVSGGVK